MALSDKLNTPTAVATTRTTVNTSVLTALVLLANKWFDWDLTLDDLLPYMPIIVVVVGVFYRASRAVADRWPKVGLVLFGRSATPTYDQ